MKAKALCDEALLTKIQGYGNEVIDMIANDFRYHKLCMDKFMTQRVKSPMSNQERDQTNEAFDAFITEVTDKLLKECSPFHIIQLSDRYLQIFETKGITDASIRSDCIQKCLVQHFGDSIQIVGQNKTRN